MSVTSPFGYRSTALEVITGHDLTGQTAIITGASSGLGIETIRALLSAGAEVVMAVRDTKKAEVVAAELRQSTKNSKIHLLELNLSSLASVRKAAAEALAKWSKLHILINNAGVMATPYSHTEDGFEMQFGTNHLGHYLFSTLLLPALQAAAPSRVVVLSSIGHRRSDINFEDLNYQTRTYEKWEAYGQSKTANALFAVAWNQIYGNQGVTANALHPGGIQTGLQKFIPEDEQRAMGWIDENGKVNPLFKTVEQGAATSIWAAVGQELNGIGGLYLEDCNEALPFDPAKPYSGYMPYARDLERAEKLWEISAQLVN
jgi:NAD(P)-dependent dehydrogenase (short-subunit alcohol dehydrogenase family)